MSAKRDRQQQKHQDAATSVHGRGGRSGEEGKGPLRSSLGGAGEIMDGGARAGASPAPTMDDGTLITSQGDGGAGCLYLVATPIGNLDDITLRALETLRQVDIVASEDTRKTGLLLKHFAISRPQIAFHEHNEQHAGEQIEALLKQGKSVAVVTNAGTPGISDPGFTLVRRAIAASINVTMIPGPTAFVMALVLSGLPVHSFTFRGFPPRKPVGRRKFLEIDRASPHTLIFYESPYRLEALLSDALEVFGEREAALANDLTKLFETVQRGTLSSLRESVHDSKTRGEYIVVIAGMGKVIKREQDER